MGEERTMTPAERVENFVRGAIAKIDGAARQAVANLRPEIEAMSREAQEAAAKARREAEEMNADTLRMLQEMKLRQAEHERRQAEHDAMLASFDRLGASEGDAAAEFPELPPALPAVVDHSGGQSMTDEERAELAALREQVERLEEAVRIATRPSAITSDDDKVKMVQPMEWNTMNHRQVVTENLIHWLLGKLRQSDIRIPEDLEDQIEADLREQGTLDEFGEMKLRQAVVDEIYDRIAGALQPRGVAIPLDQWRKEAERVAREAAQAGAA